MTEIQTVAWIFISTAIASQESPANRASISSIADGINHAVPTEIELTTSLDWLCERGLVANTASGYALTTEGRKKFGKASAKTSVIFRIWERAEKELAKLQN